MTYLVVGATGTVGRAVVDRMLAAGHEVRATSRNPDTTQERAGVEMVTVDLSRPVTLEAALAGVEAVFLYARSDDLAGLAAALAASGVDRTVLLSSSAVVEGDPHTDAIAAGHAVIETAIVDVGVPLHLPSPWGVRHQQLGLGTVDSR